MGGHNAGEIAAEEAVRFMCTSIEEIFANENESWDIFELYRLNKLIMENANSWVHRLSRKKKEYSGMGTTLCSLLFHEKSLIYAHIGDSRIYRLRDKSLEQITHDHSLKNKMIADGRYSKTNKSPFPYKNILTRAIGTHREVEAEIHIAPVMIDDVYLMCSDGLSDYVSDEEIASILEEAITPEQATINLIERAKRSGGNDNITVVITQVKENANVNLLRQQRDHASLQRDLAGDAP